MTNKQQKLGESFREWEKEFELLKEPGNQDIGFHCEQCEAIVKRFIKDLLQKSRQADRLTLLEKIKGMKQITAIPPRFNSHLGGFNAALDTVVEMISKENK